MTAPAVPERVRTVAYFVLLGCSAVVLLIVGLAPVWLDADLATRVVASGGVITSVFGVIAGGLGVAYRPTATSAGLQVTDDERQMLLDERRLDGRDPDTGAVPLDRTEP